MSELFKATGTAGGDGSYILNTLSTGEYRIEGVPF